MSPNTESKFYSYGSLEEENNQYVLIDDLYKKFGITIFEVRLRWKTLSIYLSVNKNSDKHREFCAYCISVDGDFASFEVGKLDVPAVIWEFD